MSNYSLGFTSSERDYKRHALLFTLFLRDYWHGYGLCISVSDSDMAMVMYFCEWLWYGYVLRISVNDSDKATVYEFLLMTFNMAVVYVFLWVTTDMAMFMVYLFLWVTTQLRLALASQACIVGPTSQTAVTCLPMHPSACHLCVFTIVLGCMHVYAQGCTFFHF